MDIEVDRNAYERQTESFEESVETTFGKMDAVFIRAPKITRIGKEVNILSRYKSTIIACEQRSKSGFYIATCFHPELTTTAFHEYFIKNLIM